MISESGYFLQWSIYLVLISCYLCSETVVSEEVPPIMEALVAEKRRELIEVVSEVDDRLAELFLADEPITSAELEVHWTIK